jgi:hypothetical protein
MKTVTGKKESYDVAALSEAFRKYTANSKDGVYPTIIFDVERGSEETEGVSHKGVLQDVRSIAHGICKVCHCLIVVSEANAIFQFGSDPREQFIYVDEMTFEETKRYLKSSGGKPISDEDMKKIYDKIGGNPAQLTLLLTNMKTRSLDDSIKAIVGVARDELKAFTLQPILKALKLKEHVNGVEPGYFEKQEYKNIDMTKFKAVGDAMKEYNAIVYRIDKDPRVYEMISTRHKTALKDYEPVIDYNSLTIPKSAP